MMNKMKSAGVHLVKFLFILPFVAVLLVAFRNNYSGSLKDHLSPSLVKNENSMVRPVVYTDTVPSVKVANSKGYFIDIKGNKGECTVVVKDKNGKEVEAILLNEWAEKADKFEGKYGEILPPPNEEVEIYATLADEAHELIPAVKCCAVAAPCAVGTTIPCLTHTTVACKHHLIADEMEITDKAAIMKLKNGKIEKFDLTKPEQRAEFEAKYGKIITTKDAYGVGLTSVGAVSGEHTVITPFAPRGAESVTVLDERGYYITGKEDVLITITKNTTREELEKLKSQMKAKDIELIFDEIEYNEKGKLVLLSGRMKSKDGQSNFVAVDFEKLVLAMIKKDDQTFFKVSTKDNKEVI